MKWFEIDGWFAHQGAGQALDVTVVVKAGSADAAMQRYYKLPGIKKSGKWPISVDEISTGRAKEVAKAEGISLRDVDFVITDSWV